MNINYLNLRKMKLIKVLLFGILFFIILFSKHNSFSQTDMYPHPSKNPESSLMLSGEWIPENTHEINFFNLPHIQAEHSIVSDVRYAWGMKTNQHNYLVHFDGRFWAMWSDGPGLPREGLTAKEHRDRVPGHDRPGQMVSYSTSKDGINWSEPRYLTEPPFTDGFGWIARGFYVREGKLLALVTLYNAPGYRGKGLQLHAYEMVPGQTREWKHKGLVFDNAMNNFPPKKLPNGEWMMSRRDSVGNVYMLIGGVKNFNNWESVPVISYQDEEVHAEEPYWLILPDNNLVAFFRDNKRSGFLYRAFSTDNGTTWTRPVRTNFPDATSKFSGLRLSDGRYVLVSNSNPKNAIRLPLQLVRMGLFLIKWGTLLVNDILIILM
jgi:hypothetical protein